MSRWLLSVARARAGAWVLGLLTALVLWALVPAAVQAKPSANAGLCRPQRAQEFLKRPHFVRGGRLDGKRNDKTVRFRVERYGSITGLPFERLNAVTVQSRLVSTQFFGLGVQVHRSVAPALRCVERRIRKRCTDADERYKPRALGGFRQNNTFRGGELSNHLFGIAVDIDPDRNPCCGCVEPWPEHPACQGDAQTVFERTELPRCWIYAFERYGFYWLGRDPILRDTMHFEFLGNPDRVLTE